VFPHVKKPFHASDWWQPGRFWHEFIMPETACREDTPNFLGAHGHDQSVRDRHLTTPAMTLQQILLMVDWMDVVAISPASST
jgi:hypothetical protein